MRRYLLHFEVSTARRAGWSPVVGVTGLDLGDCLDLAARCFGPGMPPLTSVQEDPDVPTLPLSWAVGVPVWRGVWCPPYNLAGPEPVERRLHLPRWWTVRDAGCRD